MSTFEIRNIRIASREKVLVDDFSLKLEAGELQVIMGRNGSGKSSLVNGIFGHPKFSLVRGSLFLDDEDITQYVAEEKARKGLFLSMQHLPEISGVSLVNFLHRIAKEVHGDTRTPLQFHDDLSKEAIKYGLNAELLLAEVNSGVSGGEKKQAELLQLLALRPKFAFLDEIDSGVDIDALKKVYEVITLLRKEGIGFIIVSHHAHILEDIVPTGVTLMSDGKILEQGGVELIKKVIKDGFEK